MSSAAENNIEQVRSEEDRLRICESRVRLYLMTARCSKMSLRFSAVHIQQGTMNLNFAVKEVNEVVEVLQRIQVYAAASAPTVAARARAAVRSTPRSQKIGPLTSLNRRKASTDR